jgi:hypothetical protein
MSRMGQGAIKIADAKDGPERWVKVKVKVIEAVSTFLHSIVMISILSILYRCNETTTACYSKIEHCFNCLRLFRIYC